MRFIEALKLKSKLFFLFVLIMLGPIFVAIVGTSYINAMKKNVDSIHKANRQEISTLQATQNIEKSLSLVKKMDKLYLLL